MSRTTKTAVVLMTALVPTTGHRDLVEFARHLPQVSEVLVVIQARTFEPIDGAVRAHAIRSEFKAYPTVKVIVDTLDDAPQNPGDHDEFWTWWATRIAHTAPTTNDIVLVASEEYGVPLAQAMGCEFMPYDIARQLNPIKGEKVRHGVIPEWDKILPGARRHLGISVTLFGQESVGKTTMAKALANADSAFNFVPEYAREYLETVGIELTQEKMNGIAYGQYSFQAMNHLRMTSPFLIQDTDLYSTIGYSRFGGYEYSDDLEFNADLFRSDVYFLMPDDIPIEPDPIRYGGNVRESTYEFWRDLGHEYGLNIVEVPRGTRADKEKFILSHLNKMWKAKIGPIEEFVRE